MPEDQEKDDSVFDFLYADNARMALFMSQFHQYGELVQITKSSSKEDVVQGGLLSPLAKASVTEKGSTQVDEQFDSKNLAPLKFLDEVNRRNMIVRDGKSARIGQLVLITGALKLLDMSLLKGMWSNPEITNGISSAFNTAKRQSGSQTQRTENRAERRAQGRDSIKEKASANASPIPGFLVKFLEIMPHTIQGSISQNGREYWLFLKQESLKVDPANLLMQYGIEIAGDWSTLAILDAVPSNEAVTVGEFDPNAGPTPLFDMLERAIVPIARMVLGRPQQHFGITPILIFREVNGRIA